MVTRTGAALAAAFAMLAALSLALLSGSLDSPPTVTGGDCRLVAASGAPIDIPIDLDREQLTNASIVVSTAEALGLPADASVVGLATALQESGLRVLTQAESDSDSAGIFQQRPSQGWGSVEQVMDPVYAAQAFFEHLTQVSGWQDLPVTVAAQTVQRSAYPDAYAKWQTTAEALASALLNQPGVAQVSCQAEAPAVPASATPGDWPPEQMGADGLTARTRYVRDLIESGFGETNMGGWCPGGCTTGHVAGSDHYTGHAIDVMILPYTDPARVAAGERICAWLVANARQLAIKYVIYRAQIWTPEEGWHTYSHPTGSSDPTMLHMDHVHVSLW